MSQLFESSEMTRLHVTASTVTRRPKHQKLQCFPNILIYSGQFGNQFVPKWIKRKIKRTPPEDWPPTRWNHFTRTAEACTITECESQRRGPSYTRQRCILQQKTGWRRGGQTSVFLLAWSPPTHPSILIAFRCGVLCSGLREKLTNGDHAHRKTLCNTVKKKQKQKTNTNFSVIVQPPSTERHNEEMTFFILVFTNLVLFMLPERTTWTMRASPVQNRNTDMSTPDCQTEPSQWNFEKQNKTKHVQVPHKEAFIWICTQM